MLARLLKLLVVLAPIVISVGFVAFASRVVRRPEHWYGVVGWWIGLTLASTVVLAVTERVMRKVLPLVALFSLSLVFPDHAPSRFKVAMRTNTLRQLQRSLEAGESDHADFQEAAEQLVALAGALNAHDRMTRGHTERVRAYTLMIGEETTPPEGGSGSAALGRAGPRHRQARGPTGDPEQAGPSETTTSGRSSNSTRRPAVRLRRAAAAVAGRMGRCGEPAS